MNDVKRVLINQKTGKEPTPDELDRIILRAYEIMDNPYSNPDQIEWATLVLSIPKEATP